LGHGGRRWALHRYPELREDQGQGAAVVPGDLWGCRPTR
jgi:hypothetical protein